jgi:ABC-2 type transport system ATP-binding protein
MRCELIASLLHNPKVLFLDEPTIGLDIISKNIIRGFIKDVSKADQTTVMLTSHDTADMEQVCQRAIIINKGEIVLDSAISKIRQRYLNKKIVSLATDTEHINIKAALSDDTVGIAIVEQRPFFVQVVIDISKTNFNNVLAKIMTLSGIIDVTIEDPSLEETICNIYGGLKSV